MKTNCHRHLIIFRIIICLDHQYFRYAPLFSSPPVPQGNDHDGQLVKRHVRIMLAVGS